MDRKKSRSSSALNKRTNSTNRNKNSKQSDNNIEQLRQISRLNCQYAQKLQEYIDMHVDQNISQQKQSAEINNNNKSVTYSKLLEKIRNLNRLLKNQQQLSRSKVKPQVLNNYQQLCKYISQAIITEKQPSQIGSEQIKYFISIVSQKRSMVKYYEQQIIAFNQSDESQKYKRDLQQKIIAMQEMLDEEEQKHNKYKNKLEKLADQNRKANKNYDNIRKQIIQKQIMLRKLQG